MSAVAGSHKGSEHFTKYKVLLTSIAEINLPKTIRYTIYKKIIYLYV